MAHKTTPGTLIHCEYCGEDFSATYKRCPFCGEKPGQNATEIPPKPREDIGGEDDYVFEGGDVFDDPEPEEDGQSVRKSNPGRRAVSKGIAVNWPRLITFVCSLVIIVAALVIVFAYIYPRIHGNSSTAGKEPSTPPASQSAKPSDPADPSSSVQPSTSPSETPDVSSGGSVQSITLNYKEFTLVPDASKTVTATVNPAGWDGTVTWTSSNTVAAKVDQDGTVTNVNVGANTLRVTITATAGDKSAEIIVYCRPGSTPSSGLGNGATGTVTNVSTYLRVRSGPGTTYDAIGRLRGGDKVTIVADAGNGWYEIDYEGGSGFIMGEYIKVG